MKRIDEIEQRNAEINALLNAEDTSGLDLDAIDKEMRSLKAEKEEIIAQAAKEAELRSAVDETTKAEIRANIEKTEKKEERKMFDVSTKEYRSAWLKNLMGLPMSAEERSNTGMDSGTGSGGYAIPTITYDKIIENLVQIAPLVNEINLLHLAGNVTIAVEGTRNAASLHTENTAITAQDDTLIKVSLGGYEIVKLVPISATLDNNSIDGFEAYLVNNLARSLAEAVENYIVNGTGSSQPKGLDKLTWTASGDGQNAVDWAATAPTVGEIQTQMGLLNGAYLTNAKWLMNWKTFMTYVHTLRDDKKAPVFERVGKDYFVFGFPVVFSSKCADGSIYFGDIRETVVGNFAKDITIEANASSGFRYNAVDYRGTCLFDCNVVAGRMTKSAATIA